jgi:hypothetical protein
MPTFRGNRPEGSRPVSRAQTTDKLGYDPTEKQGDTMRGTAISTQELRNRMRRTERLETKEDHILDWIVVAAVIIAVALLMIGIIWMYSVKFGGEEVLWLSSNIATWMWQFLPCLSLTC